MGSPIDGEDKALILMVALILLALLLALGMAVLGNYLAHLHDLPKCQEDEVIVGQGDYREGYWDRYYCENRKEVNDNG